MTLDVRVGAARSAFELLTDGGDETKRLVRAYGNLMHEAGAASATYQSVFWAKGPVELTADEWWMTRFCELRNAIVHGQQIPADLWDHQGHHQLNHIHDRLITALRTAVAKLVGDSLLQLVISDRAWARIREQAADMLDRRNQAGGL